MDCLRSCEREIEPQINGVLRDAMIERDFFQPGPVKHSLQIFHFVTRKWTRPRGFHAQRLDYLSDCKGGGVERNFSVVRVAQNILANRAPFGLVFSKETQENGCVPINRPLS